MTWSFEVTASSGTDNRNSKKQTVVSNFLFYRISTRISSVEAVSHLGTLYALAA